jgi:hypothetical protein
VVAKVFPASGKITLERGVAWLHAAGSSDAVVAVNGDAIPDAAE